MWHTWTSEDILCVSFKPSAQAARVFFLQQLSIPNESTQGTMRLRVKANGSSKMTISCAACPLMHFVLIAEIFLL